MICVPSSLKLRTLRPIISSAHAWSSTPPPPPPPLHPTAPNPWSKGGDSNDSNQRSDKSKKPRNKSLLPRLRNKIGAGKGSIGRRRGAKRAKYKLGPSRWRRRRRSRKTRRRRRRRDRQGSASTRLTYWDSRACNKQPDDKYQGPNTKHKLSDSLVYKKGMTHYMQLVFQMEKVSKSLMEEPNGQSRQSRPSSSIRQSPLLRSAGCAVCICL